MSVRLRRAGGIHVLGERPDIRPLGRNLWRSGAVTALPPALNAALVPMPDGPIGVAVSGGSDSLALLFALHETGREVRAVTVDHGLRPDSSAEADTVAAICSKRGISHQILRWTDHAASGNLQDNARVARQKLIAAWAASFGVPFVALGHTLDDQAETFLLRLARGSGVDGLAAMAAARDSDGVTWLRPFLAVRRKDLRSYLADRAVPWVDDPSNTDRRFDRVRARAALPYLADLGLGAERLAATAARMARARAALEAGTAALAAACLAPGGAGDIMLDPAPLAAAPEELRLRLLASALTWTAGARYPPRLVRLQAALAVIETGALGHGLTLHGCVLRMVRGRIAIRREPARAAPAIPAEERRWDGRWLLETPPPAAGLQIAALGAAGLAHLGGRPAGLSREALLSTPALWDGDRLVAAPLAREESLVRFQRFSAVTPPWQPDILR